MAISLFTNIFLLPFDVQFYLLDNLAEKDLLAMRNTNSEAKRFFEREKTIVYSLTIRMPQILKQSPVDNKCLNAFFKIVLLLPRSIIFPVPANYDKPMLLKGLFHQLACVNSKWSLPLKAKLRHISEQDDARIPAFVTLIPTSLMPFSSRGFAELSRRYPVPPLNDSEFNKCLEPLLLNVCVHNGWIHSSAFVEGISPTLFRFILNKIPSAFAPGPKLIEGFKKIQDDYDRTEKLILMGQWLIDPLNNLSLYYRARSLIYILLMVALVDEKSPIDRNLVQSWIPERYHSNWDLLLEDNAECGSPASSDEIAVVDNLFHDLFIKPSKKQKSSR